MFSLNYAFIRQGNKMSTIFPWRLITKQCFRFVVCSWTLRCAQKRVKINVRGACGRKGLKDCNIWVRALCFSPSTTSGEGCRHGYSSVDCLFSIWGGENFFKKKLILRSLSTNLKLLNMYCVSACLYEEKKLQISQTWGLNLKKQKRKKKQVSQERNTEIKIDKRFFNTEMSNFQDMKTFGSKSRL